MIAGPPTRLSLAWSSLLRRGSPQTRIGNLIQADQFPYRTPSGGLYDSGDYPAVFDKALELARYDELRREQAKARAAGRYVGIGLALAVDPSVSNSRV